MRLITQVETILATAPETRNSDIDLMITLWKRYYPGLVVQDKGILLSSLYELPTQDNIKRIRAKIQNIEMRYLPTDVKVFVERAKASKEWKKLLGFNGTTVSTKNFHLILTEHFNRLLEPKQETLF